MTAKTIILNVDDVEADRYAVSRILLREGFEVKEASTGTEALQLAEEIPDLILLDVRLPDISGFEICQKLRDKLLTTTIPVLLLTATYHDDMSRVRGLECGADGYLTQPIEPKVLVAQIKALLRTRSVAEQMKAAGREWQHVFDAIADGIALLDTEGKVIRCNKQFSIIAGKYPVDIAARPCWELLRGAQGSPAEFPFAQMLQSRKRETAVLPVGDKWYRIAADPLFDKTGNFVGAVLIMADVTELRQAR